MQGTASFQILRSVGTVRRTPGLHAGRTYFYARCRPLLASSRIFLFERQSTQIESVAKVCFAESVAQQEYLRAFVGFVERNAPLASRPSEIFS
jgi:hypothetical protein